MDMQTINTPEKLHQAIVKFLQSDYSHEDLVKMYDDVRKCAIRFRGDYSTLPALPACKDNPSDGLQDIMGWCIKASEIVDDIVSNLERRTISEIVRQLKKLRDFPKRLLRLGNSKLLGKARKEVGAIIEKERKNFEEKCKKSMLKLDNKLKALYPAGDIPLVVKAQANAALAKDIGWHQPIETKEIVQIYLSKDPAFTNGFYQLDKEIREVIEKINKLKRTPTGELLDIYCKLKDIPLKRQLDDVGFAYTSEDAIFADVIFGKCSRLYTSIDNVIKTFKEIQTKAKQKTDKTSSQAEQPSETGEDVEGNEIMKTSKENWEAIRSEYDISRIDFGRKINFVKDVFKREIIFRDVEHAFVLASEGYSKPALILAGGVIEELLRQYLEHKNIKPKDETFFAYIKACENNDLLKSGVSRLTDSIRDFRNLVHLNNEKTKRHTVSKATAKGAVASIFTIANDFQ